MLGICYGMQLIASALDGGVESAARREYGPATIEVTQPSPLFRDLPRIAGCLDEPRRPRHAPAHRLCGDRQLATTPRLPG